MKKSIDKLRNFHDSIKEHPYWNIFDYTMFRNEVWSIFKEMMNIS